MIQWIKRWHRIGYRELYYRHFGGAHEGDKGCDREYRFLIEVTSGWKHAFESERSLRLEGEEFLIAAGIESPVNKRDREWKERMTKREASK